MLLVLAGLGVAVGVYLYVRWREGKCEEAMRERTASYRAAAEQYARNEAKRLAHKELEDVLKRGRGVRHDLGDPGIAPGLAASHSFETGIDEIAISSGEAVQTETAAIGSATLQDQTADLQPPEDMSTRSGA